jgi:hypothetical protein
MCNIITGEKIQQLCDIYLGSTSDFHFNPNISRQFKKHKDISYLIECFDNPHKIFCYSHNINLLSSKIHFFKNPFILVTHNSDGEIRETHEIINILSSDKVIKWYGQNICFEHPKLHFLPIGLANSQWSHGNLSLFYNNEFVNKLSNKVNKIYFNFNIRTNPNKRQLCYDNLKNKLEWLNTIDPIQNQIRLSTYEFCICPEGNGVDSHRLWECLYLKVIPIVIKSEFTNILLKLDIPLVVLDSWSNLDINKLNYSDYNFDSSELNELLSFENLKIKLSMP